MEGVWFNMSLCRQIEFTAAANIGLVGCVGGIMILMIRV